MFRARLGSLWDGGDIQGSFRRIVVRGEGRAGAEAAYLLIDDKKAHDVAADFLLDTPVLLRSGSLLMLAKEEGLIERVKPFLERSHDSLCRHCQNSADDLNSSFADINLLLFKSMIIAPTGIQFLRSKYPETSVLILIFASIICFAM